ncbi:MAG TPA: sigma-70 family RNA polymerase sigma factor, partial [Acidimicrobiales bacterium]|nr:sigma-70 family RNA polymerase sigma factor [Acidimicrobiales bacterium]
NCGMIGLIEAIERFTGADPSLFPKYAPFRIRGAIIDELRRQDWVPRRTREKAKALEAARERLEAALRRSPDRSDLARALGLAEVAFDALLAEVAGTQVVSLTPAAEGAGGDWTTIVELICSEEGPDGTVLARALSEQVRRAMEQLSERERRILVLAYIENLTQAQIGEILGVSHSRVSQLKKRALAKLRHLLAAVDGEERDVEQAAV